MFTQPITKRYKVSPTHHNPLLVIMGPNTALNTLTHLLCFAIFSYQIYVLLMGYQEPGPARLHTVLQNKNLTEANVSLVFKICYTPSYNTSVLQSAGYENVMTYFLGVNDIESKTVIGWAGENKTWDIAGR